MKSHASLQAEAEAVIYEITGHEGLELVDVEFRREPGGCVLRVLIDRQPGGVTIAICADISRQIGDVLEVKDLFSFPFRLEVSSPGVNRPLKKPGDFEARLGETVSLTTVEPLDGRKHFKGRLTRLEDGVLGMEIDGGVFSVPLSAVKKAHVEYDFSRLKQPKKKHS